MITWYLGLHLPVQSVPITTKAVSLNPIQGEVYSIQHYLIKFVSDLRQVGGFLRVLRFSTNKTDRHAGVEFKQKFQLDSRTSRYKNQRAPQIYY